MSHNKEDLRRIYDRTSGHCHICHKKLALKNYGCFGERGAWEIEHSTPKANGGTNRSNNLYAACVHCNRSKGVNTTRAARRRHGKTRAPLCVEKRETAKLVNGLAYGGAGAAIGSLFGPLGTLVGAVVGAKEGYRKNPDR